MKAWSTVTVGLIALALVPTTLSAATVEGSMRLDPDTLAGADEEGHPLLFSPKPLQLGSSHSHFDPSATPNLLMEPSINPDLDPEEPDLALQVMRDLGWRRGSADIRIEYGDSPGEGFQDSTLGAQRKAALEAAVDVWASLLGSGVSINVQAEFLEQACGAGGATLASAGPEYAFRDFQGGEPGVWYTGPLAESLSNENLSLDQNSNPMWPDLRITFNSRIDEECLGAGTGYYYGLNGNAPGSQVSFRTVALHELGHGLGFTGLVDLTSGGLFRGDPDIYTSFTYDTKKKKLWIDMSNGARKRSAKRPGKVSFVGPETAAAASNRLGGRAVVEIAEPRNLRGTYPVGTAAFGPSLDEAGISGQLALVDDGSNRPTYACQAIRNLGEVEGRIAVIDRGDCLFVEKVKNAQNAGAIGAIIIHNEKGDPPALGGSDPTIDIPAVRIGKRDGKKIKRKLKR